MALLPIPSGLITSNEFESVQGFNASGAPVVVPKTNFSTGGREVLTADRNYYVRTDGNDSNTGLENTAGGAFQTIQKAVNVVCALDMSIYQVTINVGANTQASPVYESITLHPTLGLLPPVILGDAVTPANVIIQGTNTAAIRLDNLIKWRLNGTTVQAFGTANDGISVSGGFLEVRNCRFGPSRNAIRAQLGGHIQVNGTLAFAGGTYTTALSASGGSKINHHPDSCVIENAMTVSVNFCRVESCAVAFFLPSLTYNGADKVTGSKYTTTNNGCITGTQSINYFPGTIAGGSTLGGQYA